MKRLSLTLAAFFLLASSAFAQVGALPYHYKITTRTGTGGAGADYVLTFEIHDANHVVKGTDTCNYATGEAPREIKQCIGGKVNKRAATDAGGTAALITAMLGVDNDMDSAPAPAGGSDPWTYVVLASDFSTTSATAVNVTGLAFTPGANLRYEIQGQLMTRTATATVGPRPGNTWPTGLTDGVVTYRAPATATGIVWAHGNISAEVTNLNTGVATTTGSWPNQIEAMLVAGATPSGAFQMRLTSETAGTQVTMKAGSFIRYRIIP